MAYRATEHQFLFEGNKFLIAQPTKNSKITFPLVWIVTPLTGYSCDYNVVLKVLKIDPAKFLIQIKLNKQWEIITTGLRWNPRTVKDMTDELV